MNALTIVGIIISTGLIAGLAIYSGKGRSGAEKNDNSASVVAGVIMGTLVGGSSTVGTAQLAYNYGMSAWWFTLGAGIGCLLLGLFYIRPLRRQGCPTLVGMIRNEYGQTAGLSASLLNSLGTFINILSQLLAASAVILVVWPLLGAVAPVFISALFMILYVAFGGTKGAGMVGILKMLLLYFSMIACGILVLRELGGTGNLIALASRLSEEDGLNYFSVFCRGFRKDIGSCLSLIFGVLTTQTYAQGVLTARSDRAARIGALSSAILIPPIGVFGIMVGLYMRTVTDAATFDSKTALTQFVLMKLPALPAGIVLGALFIASVGTGAGLALGISTILRRDLLAKKFGSKMEGRQTLVQNVLIIAVLIIASFLSTGPLGDVILNFAFMSMGLRGATVFAPLFFILFTKRKIHGVYAVASIIVGPVVVLLFQLVPVLSNLLMGWSSLIFGMIAAFLVLLVGFLRSEKPAAA